MVGAKKKVKLATLPGKHIVLGDKITSKRKKAGTGATALHAVQDHWTAGLTIQSFNRPSSSSD